MSTTTDIPRARDSASGSDRYTVAGLAGGLCLLVLTIYLPTVASMVQTWMNSETFTHGFLIAPISLWLVWRDRARLARIPVRPFYPALVLVLGASVGWLLAHLVSVLVVQQLAVVAVLICVLWALLGTTMARALAFPLGFLVLAVPMGKGLEPPMMDLTAEYTVWLIRLSGIPVYRENLFFMLPSGNWSVVEACSGVRYIIASVTLGLLYAHLTYRSLWRKALFVLASILVPIVANVLRAYGIVMIGHVSDMQLATGVDHLIYGWVFFGLVMLLLFWIGGFWQEAPESAAGGRSDAPTVAEEGHGSRWARPTGPQTIRGASGKTLFIAAVLAFLVSLTGPLAAEWSDGEATRVVDQLTPPLAPPGWHTVETTETTWEPLDSGAQRKAVAHYQAEGEVVSLFLQQFLQQAQGAELVDSRDRWATAEGEWRVLARRRLSEPAAELSQVEEVRLRDLASGREYLGWFWYRVNERESADPYVTKLLEALERLTSGELLGARVTLLTPLDTGTTGDAEAEARARLQDLAGAQRRAIDDALAQGLADASVADEDAAAAEAQ